MPCMLAKTPFKNLVALASSGFLLSLANSPILLLRSTSLPTPPQEEQASHNSAAGPFPNSLSRLYPRPAWGIRHRITVPVRSPADPPNLLPDAPRGDVKGSSLRAGAEQGGQRAPRNLGLALPRTPALLGVARGPTSRAHQVGERIVAEAQASGRGRSRLNPDRALGKGRRSGRRRPARLPAQLPGPRCPGGGRVTGGAGPSATPATQSEGLRGLRAAPAPTTDHTHHPPARRAPCSDVGGWPKFQPCAHTQPYRSRTRGRARADHVPSPNPLVLSLARAHARAGPDPLGGRRRAAPRPPR